MNEIEVRFIFYYRNIASRVYDCAAKHGWWDKPREDGTVIALMHSELSEALEGLRHGK